MHKSKELLLGELSESSVIQCLLIFLACKAHFPWKPLSCECSISLQYSWYARLRELRDRAGISNFALLDKLTLNFNWILESGGLGLKT